MFFKFLCTGTGLHFFHSSEMELASTHCLQIRPNGRILFYLFTDPLIFVSSSPSEVFLGEGVL